MYAEQLRGGLAGLSYDGGANTVGNLTAVAEDADFGPATARYDYDLLHRLISETRVDKKTGFSNSFVYDQAGNIVAKNGKQFASYDAANKIATLQGGSAAYDGDGNLTAATLPALGTGAFIWDTRNHLRAQSGSGASISYKYDGNGHRVAATPEGRGTTFYVFAGDLLVGEVADGVATVSYSWGADGLVAETLLKNAKTYFYHFGPQGESRELSNDAGAIADSYLYDAYGNQISSGKNIVNRYLYGGKWGYYTDGPFALMLAGARWYSPQLMRWLSRDPIGYAASDNLYEYVADTPVMSHDPSGLDPDSGKHTAGECKPSHLDFLVHHQAPTYTNP